MVWKGAKRRFELVAKLINFARIATLEIACWSTPSVSRRKNPQILRAEGAEELENSGAPSG